MNNNGFTPINGRENKRAVGTLFLKCNPDAADKNKSRNTCQTGDCSYYGEIMRGLTVSSTDYRRTSCLAYTGSVVLVLRLWRDNPMGALFRSEAFARNIIYSRECASLIVTRGTLRDPIDFNLIVYIIGKSLTRDYLLRKAFTCKPRNPAIYSGISR